MLEAQLGYASYSDQHAVLRIIVIHYIVDAKYIIIHTAQ